MKKTLRYLTLTGLVAATLLPFSAHGQGTLDFNTPWANDGITYFGLAPFNGFSFRLGTPPPHDGMAIIGAVGPAGYPHNGTPYVGFINTLGTAQLIVIAYTNAAERGESFLNGGPFGLVSVDLADPVAPSLSPVSITFNGFRVDNSLVTQTFTVGGGGSATFQNFLFSPDFGSGLVRVEIPSGAWAMDNLVFTVPEPSAPALLGLGLALWFARAAGWRRMRGNPASAGRSTGG